MQEKRTIRELLELARESLENAGYSAGSTKRIFGVWNRLERRAIAENDGMYSPEFGERFLLGHHGLTPYDDLTRAQQDTGRAIKMLNDVCALGYVLPLRIVKGYTFPKQFECIFNQFLEYRENLNRYSYDIRDTKLYLERFGRFLDEKGIRDIANVDMYVIHDLINSMSLNIGKSAVEGTMRKIRCFFQWAYEAGFVPNDISTHIPKTVYFKHQALPSVYTPEEVERLLHSVDRCNAMGKRDYAIILLAARTGMRSRDICELEFGNILWEANRIELVQQKTGHSLSLPLSTEVGEAIVEYLQHGRPPYGTSQKVFIKHVPDFDAFTTSTLYTHVRKYMHKAKIFSPKVRKAGAHALRHSLASLLLEKEVPSAVISGVLGHVDADTTGKYLAVDIRGLRSCALGVSECSVQGGNK